MTSMNFLSVVIFYRLIVVSQFYEGSILNVVVFEARGPSKTMHGGERGRGIGVSFPKLSAMIFKIPSYQDRYKFVFVKSGKPSGPLLPSLSWFL